MKRTRLHRDVAVGCQVQQLFQNKDYYDKIIETYGLHILPRATNSLLYKHVCR